MTPSGPLAHGVSIRPTWTTKPSPSPGRNALTFGDKEAGGFRGRIAPLRPNLPCPRLRRFTLGQTSPCADLPTRKLREIPIKSRSSHPKAASNVCFRYSHVDHFARLLDAGLVHYRRPSLVCAALFARSIPSAWRSRMIARSNCATLPSTPSIPVRNAKQF